MERSYRTHCRGALTWLATAFALSACHGSDGGSSSPLVNLGLSVSFVQGEGEPWLLGVPELGEGASDRNGDGDVLDGVATIYDIADGSLTDLGLALAGLLAVGDGLVAVGVPESGQGSTDLNADGDMDDVVLHVYDATARDVTNTGLAMGFTTPVIGAGSVAFVVSEAGQGATDLDGSGSADGFVLHVYDGGTRLTTNSGRNLSSGPAFHDHAFGFTTSESVLGGDLNGDGDPDDANVFRVFDLVLGGIEEVPLAILGRPLALGVDGWCVLVDEAAQEADLNGDGDQDDGVYFAVEPQLGTETSLGFSSLDTFTARAHEGRLALIVQEIDGVDRNLDSDTEDSFVALVRPGGAPIVLSDLPVFFTTPLAFAGGELVYLVGNQVFAMDVETGISTDLGLDALSVQASGEHFLFLRQEGPSGEDWTGDGDQDDTVVWVRDATSGATHHTGLAQGGDIDASSASALLLRVSEIGQDRDVNGDGDLFDVAWVRHDFASQTNQDLGAAGLVGGTGGSVLLDDGRGALVVFEGGQDFGGADGRDLNGDGDVSDFVLHALRVP